MLPRFDIASIASFRRATALSGMRKRREPGRTLDETNKQRRLCHRQLARWFSYVVFRGALDTVNIWPEICPIKVDIQWLICCEVAF